MEKFFVSCCLPNLAYKPADSKPFLLQMCLYLGKFRRCRKTDFTSVISEKKKKERKKKKKPLKAPHFISGQISLLSGALDLISYPFVSCF